MEEERSTAVAEQQDECEDYAVDITTASSWYKNVSYDDAKIFIRTNIESAARSFIAIGYYLKLIRMENCTVRKVMRASGILPRQSTVSASLQHRGT